MTGPHDDHSFISAIRADPDSDVPRLLYADYLDGSDDPHDHARAELIRIQCALARDNGVDPRTKDLINREQTLLQQHIAAWCGSLDQWVSGVEFRRGMIEAACMEAKTFVQKGAILLERWPIRRILLSHVNDCLVDLAESPHLELIDTLDLCGNDLGNGGLNGLIRSPYLENLESLNLSFNRLDHQAVAVLARCGRLNNLQSLSLSDHGGIGNEAIRALAESPFRLKHLDLSGTGVTAEGIAILARHPSFHELRKLGLAGTPIQDAGLEALADTPLLSRWLSHNPQIDLRSTGISRWGARVLARCPAIRGVTDLNLSFNGLGDPGIRELTASPYLVNLRALDLVQIQVSDIGARALANSPLMQTLKRIDLRNNQLTDQGINVLWEHRTDFQMELETSGNFGSATLRTRKHSLGPRL